MWMQCVLKENGKCCFFAGGGLSCKEIVQRLHIWCVCVGVFFMSPTGRRLLPMTLLNEFWGTWELTHFSCILVGDLICFLLPTALFVCFLENDSSLPSVNRHQSGYLTRTLASGTLPRSLAGKSAKASVQGPEISTERKNGWIFFLSLSLSF